ncbi:hypothetical protein Scep_003950 [Stephania cephalantha]|uniref:C2H2-type domain-containing protein n=1 Tax=Stephania cephalantha TaxID=152367 RepID=A0AAP0PYJ6_9MAGN
MAEKQIAHEYIEEEELDEEVEGWDDWMSDEDETEPQLLCLFCDGNYNSVDSLFDHCASTHSFDFRNIRDSLGLDFYSCFKLINYVRSQVYECRCWICGLPFQSKIELQSHLHEVDNLKDVARFWEDDRYLKPFMPEDSLLHSFMEDEDGDKDDCVPVNGEELLDEFANSDDIQRMILDEEDGLNSVLDDTDSAIMNGNKEDLSFSNGLDLPRSLDKLTVTDAETAEHTILPSHKRKDKHLRVSFANVVAKEISNVNEHYFGAYGSYGIHKEMISDKVRTDAYRGAILNNPSLVKGSTVLDVGCGTGILSLFAAQAGASRVIAVEASEKMAMVASQIAKDNGLLLDGNRSGVISVVQCMIEELDKQLTVPRHSVDVLVSEWMGYCLLYESMLGSVLYARDKWLKPGGAILPDTATIFVAGFGKGGTSIPFWENVYGFDMSCIGKEVVEDAAQVPIVDVIDSQHIVTNTATLQTFDLLTMKSEGMDFTTSCELEVKRDLPEQYQSPLVSCYGVVLWFETGFTRRFCKEMPAVLSTSPYTPKTHWSQTIFTFREPIKMVASENVGADAETSQALGTDERPVSRIQSRISIARAAQHRSIDISLEVSGIGLDGRKRSWPVQMFNL